MMLALFDAVGIALRLTLGNLFYLCNSFWSGLLLIPSPGPALFSRKSGAFSIRAAMPLKSMPFRYDRAVFGGAE